MNHLLTLIIFFVIGTVALYALRTAKNIAYILFVLLLGWGVLYYVGLDKEIPANNQSIFAVFNEIFKREAKEGIRYASEEGGEAIADSIRKDTIQFLEHEGILPKQTNTSKPEDIVKTSIERMHAAAPSLMDRVKKILQDFLQAILP